SDCSGRCGAFRENHAGTSLRLARLLGEPGMEATAPRKPYASDLTDPEWALLRPLLPAPLPAGAPRTTDLRAVIDAIRYRLHNGRAAVRDALRYALPNGRACPALPHDFPPEGTARDYFHRWRRSGRWRQINDALRRRVRRAEGRDEEPSAGIIDSQSAKGTRT